MLVQNHVGNVELCGYQTGRKLSEIIRGAICTVVPSEAYENCPMSILESFAHGIPVIGTTIGGIPELISDGKDGILIPPASPEALSAALRFFMENPSSVLKMGQAARRKVDGRFGVSEHLRRIEQIYEKVMSMSQ